MDDRTQMTNDKPMDDKADVDFEATAAADQLDAELQTEHTLTKPIQAHGEEMRVLKWREPTGFDIERAGNPIVLDFSGGGERPNLVFNEKKMSAMISALCQIPPSSVRQLTAADWNSVAYKLVRFFMPGAA